MSRQLAGVELEASILDEPERLARMFAQAPGFMAMVEGEDQRIVTANRAFCQLVGNGDAAGRTVAEALPDLASQAFGELLNRAAASGQPVVERSLALRIGDTEKIVDILFQPLTPGDGAPLLFVQGHEVSGDDGGEALRAAHNRVLELAIGDSPLETTLSELINIVESTSRTGVLGSILLLDEDGRHLRHGAAPSLPPAYAAAIDGAEIGPSAGSCGTAAYTAAPVFVSDIDHDSLWADYRELAQAHDLRACWSIPIMTAGRKVIGTFAMYHRQPREPTVRDLALVDLVTQTAALVIDRRRAKLALGQIADIAGRSAAQSSSSSS